MHAMSYVNPVIFFFKYFSVNMLYIFKIERNNSIHSSVAVVNYYSTLIPIIFHRLMLRVWTPFKAMCTKYNTLCDKVCQWLATGRWFSPGTPDSSSDKTDRHHITELLLKVVLNTITLILSMLSNPIDLLQN